VYNNSIFNEKYYNNRRKRRVESQNLLRFSLTLPQHLLRMPSFFRIVFFGDSAYILNPDVINESFSGIKPFIHRIRVID